MEFEFIKTLWHEKSGFVLNRGNIGEQYIFVHFLTPVTAYLNGERVDIKPGGCVIWGKGEHQRFESLKCELVHDWFHAGVLCGEFMEKYKIKSQKVYYPKPSDAVTDLVSEAETEMIKRSCFYKEACGCILEKLFIMLARSGAMNTEFVPNQLIQTQFLEMRERVHNDFKNNWTVGEMARLVNMSESAFYRTYKSVFGISPICDLNETRIRRAQLMLMRGGLSVERVAALLGYNNQYHFIRQFKKQVGTTPGKYRNVKKIL